MPAPRLPVLAASLVLAGTPLAVGAVGSSAEALSCVGRERVLADATLLLTGRVVDTTDGALEVEVDEVRRGELPGAEGEPVRLSVEAAMYGTWPREDDELADGWRSSRTWVFAPYEQDGEWWVNPCNAWTAAAGGPRDGGPPGAGWERSGSASEGGPSSGPAVLAGSAGGALALGALAVWLVRRRRTASG
ncbi:hypothetical protein [Nocardioides sp. Arc9.136]|uniref:hypothetical protein n=1 Tax=Nocardioides sp. Arc9.136 TaxID=2996826 RepID=UPI00266697B3|nr:hypothetical protein [Nocardioides sp. Arc9.136]WKN50262.1 hypothetical protein OSR43_09080 [Nocardioides sp. Arc9.136]